MDCFTGFVFRYFKPMITLTEIKAQEAVGAAVKGNEIATLVRASDDPEAILWASRHKFAAVRTAAAKSSLIPFSQLLRLYFCDQTMTVKDACKESIERRGQEFDHLLELIEEFPQLSLPLGDRKGSYDFVDTIADEHGSYLEEKPAKVEFPKLVEQCKKSQGA